MDGTPVEAVNKEFMDKLGDEGIFEGTYICQLSNIKEDVREKLGMKYLDWEPLVVDWLNKVNYTIIIFVTNIFFNLLVLIYSN